MRRLLPLVAVVLLAGCGSAASPVPPSPVVTPSPPVTASPPAPTVSAAASASADAGAPTILPIFISSEILAGRDRLLFSLTDRTNKLVAAPDVPVALEFYDVAADDAKVVFTGDARFLWAVEGQKGLYAADVTFPRAGRWGVRFTATFPDGRREQVHADFDVAETGTTPPIGGPAVSVDTPTSADVAGDLARVTTDQMPAPAFYRTSVADALAAKRPFVLVFATPAFCQTAVCGPMLENVKAVAADYPTLEFINVEPYLMQFTDGSLQPVLADGQLQAAAWTDAWGLRSEPWIFVVDGAGKVTAKFEAAVSTDELRTAFDAVAPERGAVEGIVVAIDQPSITNVASFTLRTAGGEELAFAVGDLDLTDGGFNPGHLREHMVAAERIRVEFTAPGGVATAVRLTDAP